jgi:hypothetical protein
MRIDIKDESREHRMLIRLQKVFETKNPTDTVRLALEAAYDAIRQKEIANAGAAQAEQVYDKEMTAAQGL